MLYVAEMACNSGLLPFLWTFEKPKNLQLPDVICNKTKFGPTIAHGKYHSIFVRTNQSQYIVVSAFKKRSLDNSPLNG
jgi:hypothetical protein